MLIPKESLILEDRDGQQYCVTKLFVYDTDDCAFVENKFFTQYDTKEECQKAIEYFNSFSIIKVS